jgi:5-methyltetrahydropteroyltriglutamate--homocysteine methyltransferase
MYTATARVVLPTTITGSIPRPSWYTENVGARPFRDALADSRFREQYTDAVGAHLRIRSGPASTSSPTATRGSTPTWAA